MAKEAVRKGKPAQGPAAKRAKRPRVAGATAKTENRTRTRNLVIRLSDLEREAIDSVADHFGMNATQTIRFLIRREQDRIANGVARLS